MIINKILGILFFLIAIVLFRMGLKYRDPGSADYLHKIRLFGSSILMLIISIVFIFTKKPFCEIFNISSKILCF